MTALAMEHLSVQRDGRTILHDITVDLVRAGEVVGLVGPNGSGKSTLLKAAAGILPGGGSVRLNGTPLADVPPKALARQLAYLPQNPVCHWPLSVERVVELGLLPFELSPQQREERIRRAMQSVDVTHFRGRCIHELSGGERARVFLARALAGDPDLLLVDEPGAGLDAYHQLQLMELIRARAEAGNGVVVVLHDLGLAARFCHRLLLMHEGRLAASGSADTVLSDRALAETHRIAVYRTCHEGIPLVVPWKRIS